MMRCEGGDTGDGKAGFEDVVYEGCRRWESWVMEWLAGRHMDADN